MSASTSQPFRVLVTGSRNWEDTDAVTGLLGGLLQQHGGRLVVVHGACPTGADQIADEWARARGVPAERFPANWGLGRESGPIRNEAMVSTLPDACLAFIRDRSSGASGCALLAEAMGVPVTYTIVMSDV
jgi:hypothetical protein